MAVKKNKFDRVIAIDLGNGLVKVRTTDKSGREYSFTHPSVFGYKKDVGESVNDKSLDLDVFLINGVEYVWGEGITSISETKATYGHENRYRTEAFKIMAKIVMSKIVHELQIEPKEKILIVTGVPSAETGTDREEDIRSAFMGENNGLHTIDVNDTDVIFQIAAVEVMPQALSTVIGRYLDEDGRVGNEDYENMKVAVIDIGGGTIDLDIVHELRRQKGYHSVPKGFRDVYDSIREVINEQYPSYVVSDYALLDVLETTSNEVKRGKVKTHPRYEFKPSMRVDAVDFTKALNDGIMELALDTQQAIMSKWKNQTDLDEILLVGGSADLFKGHIDEIVDGITIPPNNGNSNVEGYYRYGVYLLGE